MKRSGTRARAPSSTVRCVFEETFSRSRNVSPGEWVARK